MFNLAQVNLAQTSILVAWVVASSIVWASRGEKVGMKFTIVTFCLILLFVMFKILLDEIKEYYDKYWWL